LNFIRRRFGTLCLFHLYRRISVEILHLRTYEDGIECSETSAYKIQTPRNYPEESIQHSEHGESLKSRINVLKFDKRTLMWNIWAQGKNIRFFLERA
jgi:hypothetical protein